MDQITPIGVSRMIFGLLSQDARFLVRTVADDAATVSYAGQAFTVTVTASRPKVAVPVEAAPSAKRGKAEA